MSAEYKEQIIAAVSPRNTRIWVPKEVWATLDLREDDKILWVKRVVNGRVEILLQNSRRMPPPYQIKIT